LAKLATKETVVTYCVLERGVVSDLKIKQSSGSKKFDETAISTIEKTKFLARNGAGLSDRLFVFESSFSPKSVRTTYVESGLSNGK
jgi:TonB family protein